MSYCKQENKNGRIIYFDLSDAKKKRIAKSKVNGDVPWCPEKQPKGKEEKNSILVSRNPKRKTNKKTISKNSDCHKKFFKQTQKNLINQTYTK